jgi:hypothetical protein
MIRILITLVTVMAIGLSSLAYSEEDAKAAGPVHRLHADQWCFIHDLPKDKDIECDKTLIPTLKKDKDWCKEHTCAESVCRKCDPKEAKEYIDAHRPDAKEWPAGWKPKE